MNNALAITAILVAASAALAQFIQGRGQAAREAAIQERLTAIEEARRQDELRPRIRLRYVSEPGDDDGFLEWVNDGPRDLDDVGFTLVERSGAGWQPLRGVRFLREGLTVTDGSLGEMKIGEAVLHGVVRTPGSEPDGGTVRFRMTCLSGGNTWVLALECKIPPVH